MLVTIISCLHLLCAPKLNFLLCLFILILFCVNFNIIFCVHFSRLCLGIPHHQPNLSRIPQHDDGRVTMVGSSVTHKHTKSQYQMHFVNFELNSTQLCCMNVCRATLLISHKNHILNFSRFVSTAMVAKQACQLN